MRAECPAEDQLVALVEGRLDAAATAAVHHHVRGCSDCRLVLAGVGETVGGSQEGPAAMAAPEPLPPPPPGPGQRAGRFVLDRLLGIGGMGAVWAAHDPELGRQVAVKLLRVGMGSDGDRAQNRRRLMREAQAMAHLAHPNVVPVFEVGEMGDQLFVVLELVEGETLGNWLKQARPLAAILDAFVSAGRGLAAAHQAGIVHRDFKPENVLVGKDGRARVTDFGLARSSSNDSGPLRPVAASFAEMIATPTALTPLGSLLGTPAYMAPEQMSGGRADARSDLFSFCTALYEAVAGTRPYPGPSLAEQLRRAEAEQIEPPRRSMPGWLRRELTRGLKPNPAQRQASMEELLSAIERGRSQRRTRGLLVALLATLAVAAVTLATSTRKPGPRRPVAVVNPRDTDPHPGSDWISGALGELLATELEADPQLRLVSARTVAPALADLGLLRGASVDGQFAQKLMHRLDAELVLGGWYRLSGGQLRVGISLWGSNTNPLFTAEETAPPEALVQLARKLGARARKALGSGDSVSAERAQDSFPADAEAARLYVLGISQLRTYEPGAAIETLQQAAKRAPDNPRIESALAEAYLNLNSDVPAREAAGRAYAHKDDLPPEDRARLEILRERALRNRDRAIALARAFWAQAPDDLERGQELALLQLALAKDFAGALATIAELRKRPRPGDPRTDVLEAQVATASGDLKRALAAAQRGQALAQALGARRELAQALFYQGNAVRRLGDDPLGARQLMHQSELLYRETNDMGGAAAANNLQAAMLADAGDLPGARAQFEQALDTFRQLGDRLDEGKSLHNLSIVLRRLRDLPAAIARSQEAQVLFLELGERQSAANALTTLGHLRQDLGDLNGSIAALEESARIRRELKDPMLTVSLTGLSLSYLAKGDLRRARKLHEEAVAAGVGQEKQHAAELKEAEAQIDAAEERLPEAEAAAREGARLAAAMKSVDEAAFCEAILASALLKQGKTAEARAAVDRGMAHLAKGKTAIARGDLMVMDGRVKAAEEPRNPGPALERLHAALDEATRNNVIYDQWSARLALAELEPAESRAAVRARLRTLASQARTQGFGLFAYYAESAAARR